MDLWTDFEKLSFLTSVALLLGIFWIIPRWSRPEIYFGVTVEAGFRDGETGRRILASFRRWLVISATLVLAGAFLVPEGTLLLQLLILVQVAIVTAAYLQARRRVLPYAAAPSRSREANLLEAPPPTAGGWLGQLLPFLILAATAAFLALSWEAIPDRFGAHWSHPAQPPDRWTDKSFGSVFLSPIMGMALCALLAGLQASIVRFRRRQHASGLAAVHQARRLRTTGMTLLAVELLIAAMFSAIGLLPLVQSPGAQRALMVSLLVASVLFTPTLLVVLLARRETGFSAAELALERAESGPPIGDRTEDRHWKWGLFYYNPDDPSLWVEKRFGIGYTSNMARPAAWAMLAGLLLLVAAVVALPFLL